MNRREYKRRWLLNHERYQKRGLAIFRKKLRETAQRIPFDNLADLTYPLSIQFNINEDAIKDAFFALYFEIGVRHGKKVGRAINKEIRQHKNFESVPFESGYRQFLSNWLINNAGQKITSVREELVEYLIKFIANGIERGKDIRTISRDLQKHILSRGFYRWQIERIVRTETTAAANLGATRAGESSGVQWEKEWISSNDSRTRRRPEDQYDHFLMDGVRVPKDSDFDVQGDKLSYPGDPKGHAGNVINCRCVVAVVPKRNPNGEIIFTTSQGRTITF